MVQLSNGTRLMTLWSNRKIPEVKNPRWRPVNFNCVFLRIQTSYRRHSNWYTHVLGVQHSNGTSSDTVQPNRNWVIQDGGLKTANTSISASRQDINEIPTFSGSHFSLGHMRKLWHQTGSIQIQDGDLLTSIAYLCALRQVINRIPTDIPKLLRSSILLEVVEMMCDQTGSAKQKIFRICKTVWFVF